MLRVDTQCSAIWRKHCRCCKIRFQSRTVRLQPPCVWTRHGTECVTIRASRNWRTPSREPAEPLREIEVAERLQGCGRLKEPVGAIDSRQPEFPATREEMPSEPLPDVKFEIGHVLFIDIVGYSKLLIHEQSEQIQTLRKIVRGTEQFRLAEAEGRLLRLPTGDGGALVFRNSPRRRSYAPWKLHKP